MQLISLIGINFSTTTKHSLDMMIQAYAEDNSNLT